MSAVTIRWDDPTHVSILTGGRVAWTAGDDNDFPDELPLGPAVIAAHAAEATARALGVTVTIERPKP